MKIFGFVSARRFSMFLLIAIAFVASIAHNTVEAAPYQELEPRKGYVPVYIRYGDTPLSEVNPKLVEAFHEDESSAGTKIPSASLTVETEDKAPAAAAVSAATTNASPKEVDSDIASFDVIKAMDDAEKNNKPE